MDPSEIEPLLDIYRELPADNGDALLLLDAKVAAHMERLADEWDPEVRQNLGYVLRGCGTAEVLLAIVRPDAELLPQDYALWADLREELLGSEIKIWPLVSLPAAA